jgi:hypothetical protein
MPKYVASNEIGRHKVSNELFGIFPTKSISTSQQNTIHVCGVENAFILLYYEAII